MGSGVIIRADGYIVTNYHVIQGNDELEVKLLDGRVFDSAKGEGQVEVVGVDQDTDLAVLRIGGGELTDLAAVAFGDSEQIRVGQFAIAVGAPFSLDYSVTIGHISQKGRHGMRMTNFENYIQTDASINPGNSGGPLLNIHGEMIGINQFIMTGGGTSRGNIGLGFAIPSNLVKQVVSDLIENGAVTRPFLGLSMQELTDVLKRRYGVESGVLIESVMEDGAAEKAGIKAGDVVTHVGDKAVGSPHDLLFAVLAYKPGDTVKVTVNRDGTVKTFDVVATVRDGDAVARSRNGGGSAPAENMGLRLQTTEQGLVVTDIQPNSPATRAEPEIRVGDIVSMVNGEKVETPQDVAKALEKTKNQVVLLYVDRGRQGKFLIGVPLD
jgi:S1-C subfamily serine protease